MTPTDPLADQMRVRFDEDEMHRFFGRFEELGSSEVDVCLGLAQPPHSSTD